MGPKLQAPRTPNTEQMAMAVPVPPEQTSIYSGLAPLGGALAGSTRAVDGVTDELKFLCVQKTAIVPMSALLCLCVFHKHLQRVPELDTWHIGGTY